MDSLVERREPGTSLPVDGTFPTTVLTYKFSVADEGYDDPACAAWLRSGMCWDAVQVEVTRLTP